MKKNRIILSAEKFDEKIYRNEMSSQTVFNKMSLDPIPDELKD